MSKVEGKGMKISSKERKKRADEKKRVQPYFDQDLYDKLNRLARTCKLTDAEALLFIANTFLNHPQFINYAQDYHHILKDDPFRITPIIEDGKIIY